MKQFLLLLTGTLIMSFAFAQTGVVKGKIVDTLAKQSLKDASIVLLQEADSTVESFSLAKVDGSFELKGITLGKYILQITFQGYDPYFKKVAFTKNELTTDIGTINLKVKANDLGNVTVTQSPVTIKGDTVEFNASSFKTKPNSTAEDLLKKLPGVQVDKDGNVKAQGEAVQRVLVDGKRFFGDDPKMATKNLPTDVIDKVQVFDAQSDQSAFTGFDDGNKTKTINIITKKDKRKGYFGKFSVGAGDEGRYENSINMNRFNGNQQISFIGQGNNVNRQGFNVQDLLGTMNMGGGRGGARTGGGGNSLLSSLMTGGTTSGITTTWAGGLNYRDTWGKKTEVSGSYFYNNLKTDKSQTSVTENLIPGKPDSSIFNNQTQTSVNKSQNHRFNLNIETQFDSMNSMILRPNLSYQIGRVRSNTGTFSTKGKSVFQSDINQATGSDRDGYNASLDATFRHRFKKKGRTISLNLTNGANKNDGTGTNYYTTQDYINTLLDTTDQINSSNTDGWNSSTTLSYTEPIAKGQLLEVNYNYSYTKNNSDKQTLSYNAATGEYDIVDAVLTNAFENTNQSNRATLSYRVQKQKFNFSVGSGVQFSTLESVNKNTGTTISQNFTNLYPTANFTYNFSRSKNLRFYYNGRTSQPTVSQLQPVVDNSDQLNVTTGNPNLKQAFNNTFRLMYTSFDMITFRNFFVSANGSVTSNKIVNSITRLPNGGQMTMPVNLGGAYSVAGFINYGFPLKRPKSNLNFTTNVSLLRDVSLINTQKNFTKNTTLGETITWTTNLKEALDINFSSTSTFNFARYTLQPTQNTNYFTQMFSVEPTYVFKSGWILSSDFDYTINAGRTDGYNTNIPLWNAGIAKQIFKNKAGEIKLSVYDLLNQNVSVTRTVTDNMISDVQTKILKRYFLLSFTYNLRNFAGKGMNKMPGMRTMFRNDGTPRMKMMM